MKHPQTIDYPGGLKQLAEDVGNLRYDALHDFLTLLADKVGKDSNADYDKKRMRLFAQLNLASGSIDMAAGFINSAWRICEPHMKEPTDGDQSPPTS